MSGSFGEWAKAGKAGKYRFHLASVYRFSSPFMSFLSFDPPIEQWTQWTMDATDAMDAMNHFPPFAPFPLIFYPRTFDPSAP
jgi:hypothetical protein